MLKTIKNTIQLLIISSLLFSPINGYAQTAPNPAPYVNLGTGNIPGSITYCWNTSSLVMQVCPTSSGGGGGSVTITGTVPLPTGASTSANQSTTITALGQLHTDLLAPLPAGTNAIGSITNSSFASTQSGTWTVQPGNTANTTPWLFTLNQGGNAATVTVANALKVDGSAVTQPVSASSLPLPTGASTAANQATEITALGTLHSDLIAPLPAGSNTIGTVNVGTFPALPTGSNTIGTVNVGTFPALSSGSNTIGNVGVAQASTTSGLNGVLNQGAATTAAPTYTTGTTNPFSLNLAGGLRVDGSGVTQPVSGTVTINALPAGTNNIGVVGVAQASTTSGQYGQLAQTATTTAAPTYTTATINPFSTTTVGGLRIDGVYPNNTVSTSTPNGIIGMGYVTTAKPTYTTGNSNPLSLDVSGGLRLATGIAGAGTTTVAVGTQASLGAVMYQTTAPASPITNGQSEAVQSNSVGEQIVTQASRKSTATWCQNVTPAATPTDVFVVPGSATKTVQISAIEIQGLSTTAGNMLVSLVKRSAANTGGTSTAPSVADHDASATAHTAAALYYTANPTGLGTAVGTVRQFNLPFVLAGTYAPPWTEKFADHGAAPIVLRGVAQMLAVNLNGAAVPSGGTINICIEETEE